MKATASRWPRRDTGPARVQRGSPRWIAGLAIVVAGLLLVVSVFLDWGHIAFGPRSNSIAQVAVSGAGTVSVTMPQGGREFERYAGKSLEHVVSHSGLWVAVIGVLIVAAGAAYLWLLPREEAALAVAVLAGIGFVSCLSGALNVRRSLGEALGLAYGHYSLGFGVVVACTMTVVLMALGVAAFVLDRTAAS